MTQYNRCNLFFSKAGDLLDLSDLNNNDLVAKANVGVEFLFISIPDNNSPKDTVDKIVINVNQDIVLPDFFSSESYGSFLNSNDEKLYINDKSIFKILLFRNPNDPNLLKVKIDEPRLIGTVHWK